MILCGDKKKIDLKYKNDSDIHEVTKLKGCKWVFDVVMNDNHRNESLDEVLKLLTDY